MKTLQDRVAVITGAGSGIGRATALALAAKGCHLALSDINPDTLGDTLQMVQAHGVRVPSQVLDVADKKAMQDYADGVTAAMGQIHIVINNAGITVAGTVEEHTIDDYEWLMGINFWGVVYGTKFFLPHLQRADEAHIVNISSVFGLIAVPNQSAYNASKFAVRGFTESLKQELHGSHIGVSCVHPGGIKTNIVASSRFKSMPAGKNHSASAARFKKVASTTADKAADVIVRGIQKKKERILIGADASLMDLLARTMPKRYPRVIRMILKPLGL